MVVDSGDDCWIMQIKIDDRWRSIQPTDADQPYRYATQDDAERILRVCYPDLCREDRLSGTRERTRTIRESEL